MIPFMGAQSLVLGKAFGEGFQYGKRRISAMTNEEFNRLTPSDIAKQSRTELQQMIPSMQDAITDMRDFQSFIVKELIATAKQLPDDIFQGVTGQAGNASSDSNLLSQFLKFAVGTGTAGLKESAGVGGQIFQKAFAEGPTAQPFDPSRVKAFNDPTLARNRSIILNANKLSPVNLLKYIAQAERTGVAKNVIIQMVNIYKNKTRNLPTRFQSPIQKTAGTAAIKIDFASNLRTVDARITQLRAQIKVQEASTKLTRTSTLRAGVARNRQNAAFGAQRAKKLALLRQLRQLLLDALKKRANILTLQRNR